MEILTYKLLNEESGVDTRGTTKFATTNALNRLSGELAGKTGISTPEMQAIASTLKNVDVDLKQTNIATEFRNIGFLFLKNVPNLYVRLAPIVGGIRRGRLPEEFNQVNTSFVTIFSDNGNKCNFFPYSNNAPAQVYAESNENLLNYFSLELYNKKIDRSTGMYYPFQQINVEQYFESYKMEKRISENILFYKLKIGGKFDDINKLYKINDGSILGLKNYGFQNINKDYLIHFGGVGRPNKIQNEQKENKYTQNVITPQIVFDISVQQYANLKTQLDNLFSGRIQYNYFGLPTSQSNSSITFSRPYYQSTFQSNTHTIKIYTQRKLQVSSAPIDCFINFNNRIFPCKITVNRI